MKKDVFPQAVVFDMDGLMLNTEELYQDVGAELLRRRGKEFTSDLLEEMMGRPSPVALQIMINWHGLDSTVEQLLSETDDIFEEILRHRLAPMPGLMELLSRLEEVGIPKGIATSSRRSFAIKVLSRFDLVKRFHFLLTGEDVQQGKPHPDIYHLSAKRFGIEPTEMVVLEDSQNGARAGVAAGAIVVAVPGGHSRSHDFSGTHFIANSLADKKIYDLLGL